MRRFIVFITLIALPALTRANHIIGGEMYYQCISNNTYMFTMKLYRDCYSSGAEFDNPAHFSIFDQNNNLVNTVSAILSSSGFIEPDLNNPCLIAPPDICVQEGIYTFQVTVPSNTQRYQVVYQRCCRNETIQNLEAPEDQGLTIVAQIPPGADAVCNTRPHFNNFPPPILCAQEMFEFDHSATDADGDSLAYKLCSPYLGATSNAPAPNPTSNPPFTEVWWGTGYSAQYPMNANPALSIDPVTGLLTGKPTQLGKFVVGVCVEEWRDGQLLSVNTRDFQFNVAYCEQLSTASIADPDPEDLCEDLTFDFTNLSDPSNTFYWDFGDPTTDQDFSTDFSPTYTYPDTGLYLVTLVTNPGFFCSDTAVLELPLYYETQIAVEISDFECINGQQIFTFSAGGVFEDDAQINWNLGPNATPQTGTGLTVEGITFSSTGDQTIMVEVLDNVCEAQDAVVVNIPEPPVISIMAQDTFCAGLQYHFAQQSTNAGIFQWDFGVAGTDADVSTLANPFFTFPEPGVYTVTLTAHNGLNCPETTTAIFDIRTLLAPEIESNAIQCLEGNSVDFVPGGSFSEVAQFAWQFPGGQPGSSTASHPTGIHYDTAGEHPVTLSISENGCTRSAENTMRIHANPIADFTAISDTGCAPFTVNFSDKSFTQSSSVAYQYDFGDGESSSSRFTSHIYTQPGVYSVHFSLQNLNGCIDSDELTRQNYITVFPSPRADFNIDPPIVSVLNPVVNITGLSEGAISCSYAFDGQFFDDCDFQHTLENIVPQPITLTVENEFGCRDKLESQIRISDHLIYIPNSFTPDGDGLNDVFEPVTTGVVEMQMYIFDRWGNQIFSRSGVGTGWNGSSKNENFYAEPGVYQYLIRATDNLGWNFDYQGSVRLLR